MKTFASVILALLAVIGAAGVAPAQAAGSGTTSNLTLMNALASKMDWDERNQKEISGNIANGDTPGYVPRELTPLDMKSKLGANRNLLKTGETPTTALARTNGGHLGLNGATGTAREIKQKKTYEVAPANNAVVLEEQLIRMNKNQADHKFVSNLYQKNIDMMKMSLKGQ